MGCCASPGRFSSDLFLSSWGQRKALVVMRDNKNTAMTKHVHRAIILSSWIALLVAVLLIVVNRPWLYSDFFLLLLGLVVLVNICITYLRFHKGNNAATIYDT